MRSSRHPNHSIYDYNDILIIYRHNAQCKERMRWKAKTTVAKTANIHYTHVQRWSVSRMYTGRWSGFTMALWCRNKKIDNQQNDELEQKTSSVHAVGVAHAANGGERTQRWVSVLTAKKPRLASGTTAQGSYRRCQRNRTASKTLNSRCLGQEHLSQRSCGTKQIRVRTVCVISYCSELHIIVLYNFN